jgi:lysozyme
MSMVPSQACYDLIKHFEGFRPKAYYCPAGILSIAYGHTGLDVLPGLIVTEAQGNALLRNDVEIFSSAVSKALTHSVTQGQFDALVSFCYNVGQGKAGVKDGLITLKNGNTSTLLRKTNAGDKLGAAAEFPKWATAGGVPLKGLVIRREAEQRLYLS